MKKISVIHESSKAEFSIRDGYVERFGRMPEKEDRVMFAVMAVNNVCGVTNSKINIIPEMM